MARLPHPSVTSAATPKPPVPKKVRLSRLGGGFDWDSAQVWPPGAPELPSGDSPTGAPSNAEPMDERARILDNYHVPARYPNGHVEGPAYEHYGSLHSSQALDRARTVVGFVRKALADG